MKILHLNDRCDGRGGVERYLEDICGLLEEHGHENVVACCEGDSQPAVEGKRPVYRVGAEDRAGLDAVLRREQPDVAYVHQVRSPDMLDAIFSSLPAVAYVHGFRAVCPGLGKYYRRGDRVCERASGAGCLPMHYLRRCSAARDPRTVARLMRRAARQKEALLAAKAILVGSAYMRALLIQNGFAPQRVAVLPPHFVRNAPGYAPPGDCNCLLFVGRLEIEKGLPYLLRAMAMLSENVHLRIAGDGTQRGAYERLARELGIEQRVEFLGWLDGPGLAEEYRRCAVVVLPTIAPESFGKVGVEAMVYGRPVAAFEVGGIPEWLIDGENGLLARPTDISHLAERIAWLVEHSRQAEAMGRAGRERAMNCYRPEIHARRLGQAFAEAIDFHG